MVRRVKEGFLGVPVLMWPGLIVFALASAADLAFHLSPFGWGEMMESYLGGEGYLAHLGIMAGMILTILGLVAWEATRNRKSGPREADQATRELSEFDRRHSEFVRELISKTSRRQRNLVHANSERSR